MPRVQAKVNGLHATSDPVSFLSHHDLQHRHRRAVPLQAGDDHAADNSVALATALIQSVSGDTVTIPAGQFALSQSLALKSGVSIAGAGIDHTTLLAAFKTAQPLIVGSGVSEIEMQGLTLDGRGSGNVTQGIELTKSSSLNMHDLLIANLPGSDRPGKSLGPHAIFCTSAVKRSAFTAIVCKSIGAGREWGGGIRLSWKSSGNRIRNCTIADTGRGGIFCNDGSTDNVITDNTVTGSGGVGLGIEVQNCDRSLIERNKIDHWLSVDNSSLTAVRDNTISAKDKTYKLCGIEIVDSHDVAVSGNTVDSGAGRMIDLRAEAQDAHAVRRQSFSIGHHVGRGRFRETPAAERAFLPRQPIHQNANRSITAVCESRSRRASQWKLSVDHLREQRDRPQCWRRNSSDRRSCFGTFVSK